MAITGHRRPSWHSTQSNAPHRLYFPQAKSIEKLGEGKHLLLNGWKHRMRRKAYKELSRGKEALEAI